MFGEPVKRHPMTVAGFELFSLANQEAQRLLHPYLGTEHLLLGFLRHQISNGLLADVGLGLIQTRRIISEMMPYGPSDISERPLTNAVKLALDNAADQARGRVLGLADIFEGMMDTRKGIGPVLMEDMGVSIEQLRKRQVAEKIRTQEMQSLTPS